MKMGLGLRAASEGTTTAVMTNAISKIVFFIRGEISACPPSRSSDKWKKGEKN